MNSSLLEKKVAILATDGFEQSELEGPRDALKTAGAMSRIVSLKAGKIQGTVSGEKGDQLDVDLTLDQTKPEDFDALVLPGGLYSPDALRSTPAAVKFVRGFAEAGKPIAAICHGPWLLIEADVIRGRTLTSWPAIQTDACVTPAVAGSMRRSSWTMGWSPAASLMISPRSIER